MSITLKKYSAIGSVFLACLDTKQTLTENKIVPIQIVINLIRIIFNKAIKTGL